MIKFDDFFYNKKSLAITLSIQDYINLKSILKEYYSEKDIKHIDDWSEYKSPQEKFLLYNLKEKNEVITPMGLQSAVTFIDRITLKDIDFSETTILAKLEKLLSITDELYARETSNNCPIVDFRGLGWETLCDLAINILEEIK